MMLAKGLVVVNRCEMLQRLQEEICAGMRGWADPSRLWRIATSQINLRNDGRNVNVPIGSCKYFM